MKEIDLEFVNFLIWWQCLANEKSYWRPAGGEMTGNFRAFQIDKDMCISQPERAKKKIIDFWILDFWTSEYLGNKKSYRQSAGGKITRTLRAFRILKTNWILDF